MTVQHRAGEIHTNAHFLSRPNCEKCEIPQQSPKQKKMNESLSENVNVCKLSLPQLYNTNQSNNAWIQIIIKLMKQLNYTIIRKMPAYFSISETS